MKIIWSVKRCMGTALAAIAVLTLLVSGATAQAQLPGSPLPPQAQVPAAPPPQPAAPLAQPAQPQAAAPVGDSRVISLNDGYVLGPGDVVDVTVLGRAEFNPRVQIQSDGTLQLPFLGTFKAADLTVLQFREKVRRALMAGGFYADPVVNVAVSTYASRYVVVLGEVGQPGLVPIDRSYRVSEILARVGGARDTGSDYITVRRSSGDELKLDLRKIAMGGPEEDPVVNPGDKLYVPKAETYYIYGQINSPGTYKIETNMTLRMALAQGGGLTSMGSEGRVKIYRSGQEIKRFSPSGLIKNGDVIVVGERFF